MATVRIVPELIRGVKENAEALFTKRIAEAEVVPPELTGDAFFEMWLDSDVGLREDYAIGVRRGWFDKQSSMKVNMCGAVHMNMYCVFSTEKLMPHNSQYQSKNFEGPRADELGQIYHDWRERRKALYEEKSTFVEGVKKILAAHSTLKQALASWPALWGLVPDHYKDRHNEQTEARTKKAAAEAQVFDTDALNAAVITAKIVEGIL